MKKDEKKKIDRNKIFSTLPLSLSLPLTQPQLFFISLEKKNHKNIKKGVKKKRREKVRRY